MLRKTKALFSILLLICLSAPSWALLKEVRPEECGTAVYRVSTGLRPSSDMKEAYDQARHAIAFKGVLSFKDNPKLLRHFKKHGHEFGAKNAEEYLEMARDFATTARNSVLTIKGPTTEMVFRFDPSTNEFLVMTKKGHIKTYYKVNPKLHNENSNLDYFLNNYFTR